ncbi:MFS transporter [Streptomyces decoyicus]|uniref:MFS transporter n=1 Tax=Streptomyces decoyicus TaxID=249567 RepID=A0ABZ1FE86_9ACTN|nr:MFS transporter [Streptomyces decoyicus]WSB68275.1 MFS transporter [Streptomyces decoyicus]
MIAATATYRRVMALSGPVLPVVSFLGRLPTAMCQLGSLLLVARTSGSLATAGLVGGALAAGQTVGGPLLGRLADRHGQRTVVLAACWFDAFAVAALVAAALARAGTLPLALIGLLAGAAVPQIGPLARTRLVALAHRAGADDRLINTALSFEGTLDETSFVLGPALVGLSATVAHPAAALALAALLLAVCGSAFALHPTATALHPRAEALHPTPGARGCSAGAPPMTAARPSTPEAFPSTTGAPRPAVAADGPPAPAADGRRAKAPAARPARARMPRAVHGMRASMALQGVIFGACQAGITALTERLHEPAQAGLVYAAMGVMSAVAGLSLALVPARITLPTRWRAAAVALVVLSVPLLFVRSLGALYPVVVVLGVAFAPHLITLFGLTERLVPAGRLAEPMAFLTSAMVGGQALALAAAGRLAEAHGPSAAFAVAVGAAVLILCLALGAPARQRAGAPTPAAATPAGSGR